MAVNADTEPRVAGMAETGGFETRPYIWDHVAWAMSETE